MKSLHYQLVPLVALAVMATSCDRGGGDGPASSSEEPGEQPTNRVDIPASVRSNLGITFAKVERRSVAETIRVPGAFELKPLARHEYRLMLPGRVQFEVDQHQQVAPGDLLYRFQSPQWLELQTRIDLAAAGREQAQTKYSALLARIQALAKADFKRADLDAEAAGLQAELVKQEAEMEAALNTAATILNSYGDPKAGGIAPPDLLVMVDVDGNTLPRYRTIQWIEARATETGMVESLAVTDGSFVEETTLVLTTVDPTRIRFRAQALQSDFPRFSDEQQVRIVPPRANGTEINDAVEAALTIGLAADPGQRTITLFAEPAELRPWARPGVSAFLEVGVETSGGIVLAIPRSSVVKDGITHVFFKRDPGNANKAIRVEADFGVDDGRWVEIKSGLGPNDEVVLDGAYELKLATTQSGTSQKGGHFHADGTYHEEH
jgi:multidrug efflux pump subunit AcrA (membrane-fusion protein)